jgi:hypothetical protein
MWNKSEIQNIQINAATTKQNVATTEIFQDTVKISPKRMFTLYKVHTI